MKSLTPPTHLWFLLLIGAGTLVLSSGLGCGPFFRENILERPQYILRSPEFHFMDQFRKNAGAFVEAGQAQDRACTLDREMAEVGGIIRQRVPDPQAADAWLDSYRELRQGMIVRGDKSLWRVTKDTAAVNAPLDSRVARHEWPAELPREFHLYLDGAAHYLDYLTHAKAAEPQVTAERDAKLQLARDAWKSLLALAPDERRHRGTWAAWMLFRTSPPKQLAEERVWLAKVRELKSEGANDSQHFAEEATAILHRMGPPSAGGAPFASVSGPEQLRALARRQALGHSHGDSELDYWSRGDLNYTEDEVKEICADKDLVAMIAMALVERTQTLEAKNEPEPIRKSLQTWVDHFEKFPPAKSSTFTLLAWSAYGLADFETSKRCLALAPKDDPQAAWLRGKHAAMEGRLGESQRLLATAEKSVTAEAQVSPPLVDHADPLLNIPSGRHQSVEARLRGRVNQVKGDLASLQIANSRYVEALDTLLGTEHWHDTAYVAERLLSPEEVLSYARRVAAPHPDEPTKPEGFTVEELQASFLTSGWWHDPKETVADRFRYLVARKAARSGWYKEARPFYPPALRQAFDHYVQAREQGADRSRPASDRAHALWTAARIHRSLGMAFFGYELGPDYAVYGGAFDYGDPAERRGQEYFYEYWESPDRLPPDQLSERRFLPPTTADERWSNRQYGPGDEPRFHYRYKAAQLAWEAAALLPDNDELGSRILCSAGIWLKIRDPEAADRFYQALVARHPDTELGRKAETIRWFPGLDIDFNEHFPPLQ